MNKQNLLRNQKGFTLVEIIAVLVILGILAVVAVPKYFDLQTQAKVKSMNGALAEGAQRVSMYFGKRLLAGDTPGEITYNGTNLGTNAGDFTLGYAVSGGTITITATGKAGTGLAGETKTKAIAKPTSG